MSQWVFMLGVLIGLIWATRVIYKHGQMSGAHKAYAQITNGIGSYCDSSDGQVPAKLGEAIDDTKKAKSVDDLISRLWNVGYEMGQVCWDNGRESEANMSKSNQGCVQIELTEKQLLDLRWLAHIGFQYGIAADTREPYLIQTSDEAEAAQYAIEVLERSIPKDPMENDPYAMSFNRQTLIWNRWPNKT
mgnify:CR=1 FL=1